MPGLNEIIAASKVADFGGYGKRWNRYNELKQAWSSEVIAYAKQQGMRPFPGNFFTFLFVEKNRRRDPDNFISGGMKIIFDACKAIGLIQNDGWKYVHGIATYWRVDKVNPGVLLIVTMADCMGEADAINEWEKGKRDA